MVLVVPLDFRLAVYGIDCGEIRLPMEVKGILSDLFYFVGA